MKSLQISGRVTNEVVARGSKSERSAVVLEADNGRRFVLRRKGGPALGDSALDHLVGKTISVDGVEVGQTLIFEAWRDVDPSD